MNLLDLLNKLALSGGDWVIYLLIFTSLISVYVMGERYFFFRRISGHGETIRRIVTDNLAKGDVEAVRQHLTRYYCPEARILLVGLSAFARGAASVQERIESQLIVEKVLLERNLVLLGTVGS